MDIDFTFAKEKRMSINLDDIQKIAQILFYVTVALITIFTFLRVKKGLLSNVNTEYHKKVIERLDELSKTLFEEYDFDSPNHWSNIDPVADAVEQVNKEFIARKNDILREGVFVTGIRSNPDWKRLSQLVQRIKSDPFIPKQIRNKAVDLLGNRAEVVINVHMEQLLKYCDELAKGMYKGELEENKCLIHNRVNNELNKRGCGIQEIEEEVHKLRLAIQEYFQKFHP